ncbi:hypothetical protein [Telmatospirillum sp. J64-1]|nr:hypothetical protein [Telmatospirillum sp. J64-1]
MTKFLSLLFLLFLFAVIGGGVWLATSDMPAPTAMVEKVIPDERFRR